VLESVDRPLDPSLVLPAQLPTVVRSATEHPVLMYLARLAPGSRRTMRQSLDTVAAILSSGRTDALTLDWSRLAYQHTAAVRAALAERYAPATANKMLAAIRGVLKEVWRLGQVDADAYQRAADIPPVRGERLLRGRQLSAGELRALFEACARDVTPAGRRDAALLATLYGGGLRRAEAINLDLADYTPADQALVVRGKGNRERLIYLPAGAVTALARWLAVRGTRAGALFVPINRGGRLGWRRLSAQAVLIILRKRASETGIAPCSPHDFRRTAASDLLDAGVDVGVVARVLGHANIATTVRYDRRGEGAKRRAAELLHVPDVR
jgi:site-specific recombinase XerD